LKVWRERGEFIRIQEKERRGKWRLSFPLGIFYYMFGNLEGEESSG